jgi:spermidine synthase
MVSYPSKWNGKVHVKQRGRVRSLYLGRRMDIVHTRLDLDRPARLISPYQKCLLAGFGLLGRGGQEIRRVAMIGLGGGAITRFFHEKRPNWVFHSVEIDPVVVAVARAFFGVKDTPGYRSYAMDGRRFIEQAVVPYDLVIIDAFNADAAVPKTLASQEFFRIVRQKLAPGGLLAVNVLVHSRRVYASLVKTLSTAFPTVLRMPLHSFGSRNSLLLASARTDLKLDRETLRARARRVEADFGVRFGLDRCVAVIGADRLPMGGASLILDPVGGPGKP